MGGRRTATVRSRVGFEAFDYDETYKISRCGTPRHEAVQPFRAGHATTSVSAGIVSHVGLHFLVVWELMPFSAHAFLGSMCLVARLVLACRGSAIRGKKRRRCPVIE